MFLDLSLEINKASSVLKALQRFTSSEYLDGANKYICPKQKQKVRAAKCMTIDQAPAVLVVQLKRFEFSMFGHKINKQVSQVTAGINAITIRCMLLDTAGMNHTADSLLHMTGCQYLQHLPLHPTLALHFNAVILDDADDCKLAKHIILQSCAAT